MKKHGSNSVNIYVLEQSIGLEKDQLNSIGRSIENERKKAGILLGFFFLFIVDGIPYLSTLPMFILGFVFFAIIVIVILLTLSFCSQKVLSNVIVAKNFERNWPQNNGKEKFLHFLHLILEKNIDDQKTLLTSISKKIKIATLILIVVVLIVILNTTTPMFKNRFISNTPDNPMESDLQELSEEPAQNTSIPESSEPNKKSNIT